MSYYWFNREEVLQNAKKKYSKEKAAGYYLQNKEAIKEKARNLYKNKSEEQNNNIKKYQKKDISRIGSILNQETKKNKALKK